jgi:hypothetical protein
MGALSDLIASHWQEWELDGRDRRIVLCVETSIEMQPDREGFDARQADELVEEATRLMRASPSPIDCLRIIPAGRGNY